MLAVAAAATATATEAVAAAAVAAAAAAVIAVVIVAAATAAVAAAATTAAHLVGKTERRLGVAPAAAWEPCASETFPRIPLNLVSLLCNNVWVSQCFYLT